MAQYLLVVTDKNVATNVVIQAETVEEGVEALFTLQFDWANVGIDEVVKQLYKSNAWSVEGNFYGILLITLGNVTMVASKLLQNDKTEMEIIIEV